MVTPRGQGCAKEVPGGKLVITAGEIEDPSKTPLTIRVTAQERGAWEQAAKERDRRLSDWIRDTCNAAATNDTKPRAKGKP
jgi:hypothetical protein